MTYPRLDASGRRGASPVIRVGDIALKTAWGERLAALPAPAREALRAALLDLRADALRRAALQWKRAKVPTCKSDVS